MKTADTKSATISIRGKTPTHYYLRNYENEETLEEKAKCRLHIVSTNVYKISNGDSEHLSNSPQEMVFLVSFYEDDMSLP